MPEHQITTPITNQISQPWNTGWPRDLQSNFRKRLSSFILDKVGIWLRLGWCQLMQQNCATARVGAKRRVCNQGSVEDVGAEGRPSADRHPRDLVLKWNHLCGGAGQVAEPGAEVLLWIHSRALIRKHLQTSSLIDDFIWRVTFQSRRTFDIYQRARSSTLTRRRDLFAYLPCEQRIVPHPNIRGCSGTFRHPVNVRNELLLRF